MMLQVFFATAETVSSDSGFLSTIQSIYWIFAIVGTAFFGFTLLFSSIGGTSVFGDSSLEVDDISDPHFDSGYSDFQIFSLRSIMAFIAMFGWAGIVWKGENVWIELLFSFICGLITMGITSFVVMMLLRLQQDGTRTNKSLIGCHGTVYLDIPGGDKHGKVVLKLEDSTREVTAISDQPISKGVLVITTSVEGAVFKVKRDE